jgi:hypothetical protein
MSGLVIGGAQHVRHRDFGAPATVSLHQFAPFLYTPYPIRAAWDRFEPSVGSLLMTGPQACVSDQDRRAAQVAHVLSRAVRDGALDAVDALRILRHELRRRNTNKVQKIVIRSAEAQRVVDAYGSTRVPKNNSDDALHADHVFPLTEDELYRNSTPDEWVDTLCHLRTVVCVTARENYRLEHFEREGVTGPRKYVEAGIVFTTDRLPWDTQHAQ